MSQWKPYDYEVNEIIEMIKKGNLTVPQYQRGQIWGEDKKKKLIDSIKLGYPFGSILLFKKNDSEHHLIDGLQRCTTFYEYSSEPAKFFDCDKDIPEYVVDDIHKEIKIENNSEAIREKIRSVISDWVRSNYTSLSDIELINPLECVEILRDQFPSINEISATYNVLFKMFNEYKVHCRKINDTKIPAIIYSGKEDDLPEIFSRINSEGTVLTKYQIFAATWNVDKVKIIEDDLKPVLAYVKRFYSGIEDSGFKISQDYAEDIENKEVSVYQLLFGFGKLIMERYPSLFGRVKEDSNVESVGFNLVNACLANKNSKMGDLPKVIRDTFESDENINKFLLNIMKSTSDIYKLLKPYLEFKLNSRKTKPTTYHSEMQICSMISNLFIIEYCEIEKIENRLESRTIHLVKKKNIKHNVEEFKKWSFINYLQDILKKNWRGTGDKLLDEVSINEKYYSEKRSREHFDSLISNWYSDSNESRRETSKVSSPNNEEKLLLTIIYLYSFKAVDHLDTSKYDIEHLCTKKIMKEKLTDYNGKLALPISSFGNICLLPEWDNRSKKDKIIYHDEKYKKALGERLYVIERDYSFTQEDMFRFLESNDVDAKTFEEKYFEFITKRWKIQKTKILDNLFKDK